MIKRIKIDDFKLFSDFDIHFKNNDKFTLNLLIGRNGSGKSSFLDALAEIGCNNTPNKVSDKTDNTRFDYVITKDDKTEISKLKRPEKPIWDKVIRLFTGYTERAFNSQSYDLVSVNAVACRLALFVYLASGEYAKDDNWKRLINLITNNDYSAKENVINIKGLWLDTSPVMSSLEELKTMDILSGTLVDNENSASIFFNRNFKVFPDIKMQKDGCSRFFWKINDNKTILDAGIISKPFVLFDELYRKLYDSPYLEIKDLGFFYTVNDDKETLEEQFMSDGENAFLCRYAILYLLSKYDEKALILLDEPETHFNEHWKKYFLDIVCETLKATKHDVFIATHSAMLVTDAKPNELHRFENDDGEFRCTSSTINMYGANIIDIGQILFKMEGSVGERVKKELDTVLKNGTIDDIKNKINEVGPGEYRWKLRSKLKQLEEFEKCSKNGTCPVSGKRINNGKKKTNN